MLARLARRGTFRGAVAVALASIRRSLRAPMPRGGMAERAACDDFNEALLARLAHLQSLAHLFEGRNRSRDVYGAAHTNILDQIGCLVYGEFGLDRAKGDSPAHDGLRLLAAEADSFSGGGMVFLDGGSCRLRCKLSGWETGRRGVGMTHFSADS